MRNWIYYAVAILLTSLYYILNWTGYDFLAIPIILPAGCWVIWNLKPDNPID